MEQRDYILREIEKIRVVLESILGRISGGSTNLPPGIQQNFDQINEQLIEDTRINLNELLKTGNDNLGQIFKKEYGYNESNIELFGDLLAGMAKKADGELKDQLNKKAVETYEYVDSKSNSFSFNRKKKIDGLRQLLNQ